jgi:hypothetical protein
MVRPNNKPAIYKIEKQFISNISLRKKATMNRINHIEKGHEYIYKIVIAST